MDIAAGRCGFFDARAADQISFRESIAEAGTAEHSPQGARRARHLAAAVWEHLIRDESGYARHIEYCYINSVKHGLVTRVRDWPHSSFQRDVARGIFPVDWAGDMETRGEFGEAL